MCKLYFLHYCPAWLLNAWILLVMYLQLSAIRQIENNYVLPWSIASMTLLTLSTLLRNGAILNTKVLVFI